MIDAATIELPPSKGLKRLWDWIRRSILRPAGRNAPARQIIGPTVVPEIEEPLPLAPRGSRFRSDSPAATPGNVFAPIRQGLNDVPPLPHVVRELLRELSDPASSARSVARIAASDPTLAATLIRTVNSAAIGLRRKITSVSESVTYLGYSTVRSLVIRMRLQHVMPTRPGQPAYDAEDLWVHSLAVAYAAECLAARTPGVDRDFVSTLGLLHDIGKLAINSYFPASADQIRTRSVEFPGESFLDRERRILGADHAEIGAMLAIHWKLPADLVEAIRWHHAPDQAPDSVSDEIRKAAIIVHAANQLAKYCYVYSEDMEIDIVGDSLLRQAGLPGPLTRLLASPVRKAISRAIFFADETPGAQCLNAIRRFVRIKEHPPAPSAPRSTRLGEPRVGWAKENWENELPGELFTIDCSPASTMRLDRGIKAAGTCAKLTSRCTAGGIERLLSSALQHQEQLPLDEEERLPAKFVLRRLLPNLSEIAAAEKVEVIQSYEAGVLVTAVRSPALAFAHRFGPHVHRRGARQSLNGELANVLNLRWFTRILTPRDGGAIIFVNHLSQR